MITRKGFFTSLLGIPAVAAMAATKTATVAASVRELTPGEQVKGLYPYWHEGRLFLEVEGCFGDAIKTTILAKLPLGIPKGFDVYVNGISVPHENDCFVPVSASTMSFVEESGSLAITVPTALHSPGSIAVVSIGFERKSKAVHYHINALDAKSFLENSDAIAAAVRKHIQETSGSDLMNSIRFNL